jgi:glycosyltransferase involved in cell wall biosynthesis
MKFSIGIPVYKAKFLKECIESILSQTYKNFELIILNDASPENIEEIVSCYNDKRILYFENEKNIGAINVVQNWNKCLELSTGDYFVCMGDDDVLYPNYLQCFVDVIIEYPELDVFHCRVLVVNEQSKPVNITTLCPKYEDIYNYLISCLKHEREQFVGDFIYKRSTLLEKGGYYSLPLAWCSDYLTSFIAVQDKGIAYIQEPVFHYRNHSQSITSTGPIELKRKAVLEYLDWIEHFLSTYSSDNLIDSIQLKNLKHYLNNSKKDNSLSFISQFLGAKGILNGLYQIIRKKTIFRISIKNIFETFVIRCMKMFL